MQKPRNEKEKQKVRIAKLTDAQAECVEALGLSLAGFLFFAQCHLGRRPISERDWAQARLG